MLSLQYVLAHLFGIVNQSCISDTIDSVLKALEAKFVKENLGFEHLSRQAALDDHSRNMYFKLFEEEDLNTIFLVLDGTYVYVEKPMDFVTQKLTWSAQKLRNLVKPFMIALPSGYILATEIFFGNGMQTNNTI
jgi:hypothetical protein